MVITPTISVLELVVFIFALLGFLVTTVLLPSILRVLMYLYHERIDGVYRRFTVSDLREEGGRAWRLLGWTCLAAMNMTMVEPIRSDTRMGQFVFGLFLLTVILLDVVNSIWAAIDRIQNVQDAEEEYKQPTEQPQEPPTQADQYHPTGSDLNGPQEGSQLHTEQPEGGL